MKKFFILLFILIISLPAFAQNKKQSLAIAFEGSDYGYKEPYLEYPPHWSGTKYGVSAEYTKRSALTAGNELSDDDKSFFSVVLRYMQGKVDYDGYLQDGTPSKAENFNDYYFEGALNAGYVYELGSSGFSLWPYAGIGGRYLVDCLDETGPSGYRRESLYIYMPVGINLQKQYSGGFSFTINAQGDILLSGRQLSKMDGGSIIRFKGKFTPAAGFRRSCNIR